LLQCDEWSSYCEDPPNYPAHTIQQLLRKYSAHLRLLLPYSAAPTEPAEEVASGLEAKTSDQGSNALDTALSDTLESRDSIELL